MRIFQNTVEAVKEIERDVAEMGHRVSTKTYQDKKIEGDPDFETKEIIGYSFRLEDGSDWQESFKAIGMKDGDACAEYVIRESYARVSAVNQAKNPGYSWKARPEVWGPFLRNGRFSYTYPQRLLSHTGIGDQISEVMSLHHRDNQSRQLTLSIYDPRSDNGNRGGKDRVPCTMHFQVLDRNGELILLHVMRSLDLYTHLAVDLSISWLMANFFAGWGVKKQAKVLMQIGSLHAFQKDIKARQVF